MKLYTYFRSSAAFRVRIALNLKDIEYQGIYINLKPGEDEQHSDDFRNLNPQGRVPFLVDSDVHLSQSAAILEYLDEQYPNPRLLPSSIKERAVVRQMANLIACDIHPLNNLSVLQKLTSDFGASEQDTDAWYQHWVHLGFKALESQIAEYGGFYSVGDEVTLADLYLVPQVWNAQRFNVDMSPFPNITQRYRQCLTLPAFTAALPENQKDNPAQ